MAEIEIVDYTPEVEANAFAPLIDALAAAGEGKSARVTITRAELNRTKRQVREAANAAGFTAKLRKTEDDADEGNRNEDDTLVLVYTLGAKQNRPGRPRKDADTADAPAEKSSKK